MAAREMHPRQAAVWQRFLANAQRRSAMRELNARLHRSAATRDVEGLHKALLAGADVNAVVGEAGRTALHTAVASSRCVRLVATLVEHGADVDALDSSGATALHLAATGGCKECVEFLLQSAADPNVLDGHGWTAAQAASRCQDRETRTFIRAAMRRYTGDGSVWGGGGADNEGGAAVAASNAAAVPADGTGVSSNDAGDVGSSDDMATSVSMKSVGPAVAGDSASTSSAGPEAVIPKGAPVGDGLPATKAPPREAVSNAVPTKLPPPPPPPPPAAMMQRLRELDAKRAERRTLSERGGVAQLHAAWLPAERKDALPALRHNISLLGGALNVRPQHARMFIVKSFTEDDVHKAMKYSVWTSLPHNNRTFSAAWDGDIGPIYFLFSVNKSGRFVGLAQMDGPLVEETFALWAKRKFMGHFKVKWLFVQDMPFDLFKHIKLPNNEGRSVVWSRDGQEVLLEQLHDVLVTCAAAAAVGERASILTDWPHYELREQQMRARFEGKLASDTTDSSKRLLRGSEHGPRHGKLFRHSTRRPHQSE